MTQNLSLFVSLKSNIAKALFDFLTVNSSRKSFKESTLIERIGLDHIERRFARRLINKAFAELIQRGVVKSFKQVIEKDRRYYVIEK